MTMYATKTWGFDPQGWPLVTFSREGTRNRLRGLWKPGDTMLFVGTQGEPTAPEERGRALGYLEFTSIPVATRDVVNPDRLQSTGDKWPFALLVLRAWRILERPLFKILLPQLAARAPGMALASGFEALTPSEEARVRDLQVFEELVPRTPAAEKAAAKTEVLAWFRQRRAPAPGSGSTYTVERLSQPAKTYLLSCPSRGLMKIGWAIDPEARALHLSEPLVPELTGERWHLEQTQEWPDERAAYLMEQAFMNRLNRQGIRCAGEYFRPPPRADLVGITIWSEAIFAAHEARRAGDDEV